MGSSTNNQNSNNISMCGIPICDKPTLFYVHLVEPGSVKLGNLDTYNTGISIPLCKEHYKEAFGIEALMQEISSK